MDKTLDAQFLRVEKALATLVASISTYNPSPVLAHDLVAADQELSHGLADLATHQANYARIQSLKNTSSDLDAQIKGSLQLLSSTRSELLSTPATTFPSTTTPVSYTDLLSYARRISKFTLPPTYREAQPTPEPEGTGTQTNGTVTPTAPSNGAVVNVAELPVTPIQADTDKTSLPPQIAEWLNPHNSAPGFVPWPTEETIRRGALASIQVLIDQGEDPATFDPERSAELEASRKRLEEEAERAKEEQQEAERARQEQRMREEHARREAMGAAGQRVEEKPKVFTGLDLLDDMDDDDE
ncbi:hypothetical protein V501_00937 [Pseudogymnoascus sp. VKM F-4519 (FW-2642)]|nr:hypothetical protein V501_00937 [Pseudogymnoascus sp. VKM F-4519 (FW-2642)]